MFSRLVARLVLSSFLALPFAPPAAAQAPACEIVQVTVGGGTGSSGDADVSRDGEAVAFVSNADFVGANGDGSQEVFVWRSGVGFVQVSPGPFERSGLADTDSGGIPRADGDGSRVVFASVADPLGGNADGHYEIFLWDATDGLTQLTDSATRDSRQAAISVDGTRVVFQSTADHVGANPVHRRQIFLWDEAGGLQQVTSSEWFYVAQPAISDDGSRVAFEASNEDLWSANRTSHVVLWSEGPGLSVLTAGFGGDSRAPRVDGDGSAVAFLSSANVAGTNPDGGFEILTWTEADGVRPLTAGIGNSFGGAIDSAGGRVAFHSNAALGSPNEGGNREIYAWDHAAGNVRLTSTPSAVSLGASISGDGRRIAFESNGDPAGSNPEGRPQVFLALCPAAFAAEVPAATPIGSALLALLLAAAGAAWLALREG